MMVMIPTMMKYIFSGEDVGDDADDEQDVKKKQDQVNNANSAIIFLINH